MAFPTLSVRVGFASDAYTDAAAIAASINFGAPTLPITVVASGGGQNNQFVYTPYSSGIPQTFAVAAGTYTTLAALTTAVGAATGLSAIITVSHASGSLIFTMVTAGSLDNGDTITAGSHDILTHLGFTSTPYTFEGGADMDSPIFTEIGPASGQGPKGLGWVRGVTTKRGRERLLRSQSQFQAGTAAVILDNRDRRFDPTNTAGPYYPNVQPEKVLQVGAWWSGTFYPVWTGYVDDWPQMWPGFQEANVPLVATDWFKAASLARLASAGFQKYALSLGPEAYWRLNDVVGSTQAADSSGNGFTAMPNDTVAFGQTGAMPANAGTAADFPPASGGNPSAELDFPAGILTGGASGTGASMACWVKTLQPTHADTQYIFFLGDNNGLFDNFCGFVVGQNGIGIPSFIVNPLGTLYSADNPLQINDGNWHFLVGTVEFGTGNTFIYVDYIGQGIGSGGTPTAVSGFLNMPGQIGSSFINVDDFECQETMIFDYVLTPAEIEKLYKLGNWPTQSTGQFVDQVLDTTGFPSGLRNVDTGFTFCQADMQSEVQTKVLDMLQKLEQTEQGQLFIASDGVLTFQDRYHRYEYPNATSVATLGDGGGAEISYEMGGVVLNFDRAELFNDIQVTRRNGNMQEATNPASIAQYTDRTMPGLSDLLMESDVDALGCAEWILADTAYPQYRVGQLILDPIAVPALWPIVLGSDIGTVLTVKKHNIPGGGSAVSLVCRIEGIEHQIDAPHLWKCTMHVSLSGTDPWLILDDPVMDVLDSGARWGW